MNLRLLTAIWSQPILARKNLHSTKALIWVFLALLLGPALVSVMLKRDADWHMPLIVFIASFAICSAVFILYWFVSLLPYCAYQYTPANAKLLPGLRTNIRLSLSLPLIVIPALMGLCFYRDGLFYMSFVGIAGFIFAALYCAGMRDKRYFYVLGLAVLLPGFFTHLLNHASETLTSLSAVAWIMTPPMAWLLSGWIFPEAGEVVYQSQSNMQLFKKNIEGAGSATQVQLQRGFDPYFKRLTQLLGQGRNADKASLLGLAFGNTAYASTVIFNTLLYGIPVFLVIFYRDYQSASSKSNFPMQIGVLVYCLMMLQTFYFTLLKAASSRRYELALLMLTPQFKQGQTQTIWCHYLIGQFLKIWIINLVLWLVLVNCLPVTQSFIEYTFIMQIAGLVFVPGLLRNYRKLHKLSVANSFLYMLQLILVSAGLSGVHFYLPELALPLMVAGFVILLAGWTYWKWQRYQSFSVFPAASE